MRTILGMIKPVFSPEDGGGAQGAADAEGQGDGGAGADATAAAAAPVDGGGDPNDGAGGVVQPYHPEGLPESFRGQNDMETIDRLLQSQTDLRSKIGGVPDSAEGYLADMALSEGLEGHVDTFKTDPIFAQIAEQAHKDGISVPHFQSVIGSALDVMSKAGMLEDPIDAKAELEQLVPEALVNASTQQKSEGVEKRMADNFAFLDALGGGDKPQIADAAVIDSVKEQLGDSAAGHKFIEFVRGLSGNTGAQPIGGQSTDKANDQAKALHERAGLPQNDPNHPKFDRTSYAQWQSDMKAFHGN